MTGDRKLKYKGAMMKKKHTLDEDQLRNIEEPWRVFRIMAEFVDGFYHFSEIGKSVTIFGSARTP